LADANPAAFQKEGTLTHLIDQLNIVVSHRLLYGDFGIDDRDVRLF
jgi:hypothetical protein